MAIEPEIVTRKKRIDARLKRLGWSIIQLIIDCKKNKDHFRNEAKFELYFLYRKLKKEGLKPVVISQQLNIEFTEIHYKVFMDEFADATDKSRVQQFEERLLNKGLTKLEIQGLGKKLGNSLFEQLDFVTTRNGIRENKNKKN